MVRIIFDVLSAASILVLLTSGLAVIAGMMKIFNLAHGEFVLLGAVISYATYVRGWPVWLGIPIAMIGMFLFGLLVEAILMRRLYGRPLDAVLVTWALAIVIRGLVTIGLGGATGQSVPYPVGGSLRIGDANVSVWRLIIVGVTVLVIGLMVVLIRMTRLGLHIRASLSNVELARLSSIRTRRVFAFTFAIGSALAGLTGAMIVPLASLSPTLGVNYLVNSFMSLMVGGLGSLGGASLGATVIGSSNQLVAYIIGPSLSASLVLLLAVVFMRFRPGGLLR